MPYPATGLRLAAEIPLVSIRRQERPPRSLKVAIEDPTRKANAA